MGSCTFHPGRNSIRLTPPFHHVAATLHPTAAAIPSGCRRFPPGCITSRNLLPPFHPDVSHPEFWPGDIPHSPDVSHPADISGWEKRVFQLPRSSISESTDSAHPKSFAANFAQCCGVLLKLPDMCH